MCGTYMFHLLPIISLRYCIDSKQLVCVYYTIQILSHNSTAWIWYARLIVFYSQDHHASAVNWIWQYVAVRCMSLRAPMCSEHYLCLFMRNRMIYLHIIEKEGEYPTSLWYCVTTPYGVHDLCNDIHIQSVCPTTSPSSWSNLH